MFEDGFRDGDGELAGHAGGACVFVQEQHLGRLLHALADGVAVERQQSAQVDHFDLDAFRGERFGGLERYPHHGAISDDAEVAALARHAGFADRNGELLSRQVLLDAAVESLVLEKNHRVVVAHGGLDESLGIIGGSRADHFEAGRLDEPHLGVLRMEGPAVNAAAGGRAHHHGDGGVPAIAALGGKIDDLVEAAGNEIGELHFGHRAQAHQPRANGCADDTGL